jgi:hypothetical protein
LPGYGVPDVGAGVAATLGEGDPGPVWPKLAGAVGVGVGVGALVDPGRLLRDGEGDGARREGECVGDPVGVGDDVGLGDRVGVGVADDCVLDC